MKQVEKDINTLIDDQIRISLEKTEKLNTQNPWVVVIFSSIAILVIIVFTKVYL